MANNITVRSVRVNIDASKLFDKTKIHKAMAQRYRQIVQGNFGLNGQNRPSPWPLLSIGYILTNIKKDKKTPWYVGAPATLFRTGKLFNSIIASWGRDNGTVSTSNPYAAIHQEGLRMENGRNMPWRPYFPFDRAGNPTAYAQSEMNRVAIEAAKS